MQHRRARQQEDTTYICKKSQSMASQEEKDMFFAVPMVMREPTGHTMFATST